MSFDRNSMSPSKIGHNETKQGSDSEKEEGEIEDDKTD